VDPFSRWVFTKTIQKRYIILILDYTHFDFSLLNHKNEVKLRKKECLFFFRSSENPHESYNFFSHYVQIYVNFRFLRRSAYIPLQCVIKVNTTPIGSITLGVCDFICTSSVCHQSPPPLFFFTDKLLFVASRSWSGTKTLISHLNISYI
jgi:hypothetical protein